MSQPSIAVTPIAGALGAEVCGVDLGAIDDATFADLRKAWLEHQVLFFRDQDLGAGQQVAFGRRFGSLQIHPYLRSRQDEGHPEIVILESDEERPFVADGWHSDVTFVESPPMGSILRAVTVPPWGGDTLWASMYAAHDALSTTMQRLLSELRAVHDTSKTFSQAGYSSVAHDVGLQGYHRGAANVFFF